MDRKFLPEFLLRSDEKVMHKVILSVLSEKKLVPRNYVYSETLTVTMDIAYETSLLYTHFIITLNQDRNNETNTDINATVALKNHVDPTKGCSHQFSRVGCSHQYAHFGFHVGIPMFSS